MKRGLFLRHDSFMRVYGSEVLFCNPRLGGCLVISDAKEFLDELFSFPISEVITHLSKKYNVPVEEISKDIDTLLSQLYSAGVVGNDNDEIWLKNFSEYRCCQYFLKSG